MLSCISILFHWTTTKVFKFYHADVINTLCIITASHLRHGNRQVESLLAAAVVFDR